MECQQAGKRGPERVDRQEQDKRSPDICLVPRIWNIQEDGVQVDPARGVRPWA